MQRIQLFGDAAGVGLRGGPLDLGSQIFDGRESIAASGAFQIVSEAPDGTEIAGSQAGARLFNLFRLGSEILRNQRLYLLGDRNLPRCPLALRSLARCKAVDGF